jgi:hypothetical protein
MPRFGGAFFFPGDSMPLTYMTHPHHGATHAADYGDIERLQKYGWKVTPEPTAAEIFAAKKGIRADALKAELAALDTPVVEHAEPKKPGRPKKA